MTARRDGPDTRTWRWLVPAALLVVWLIVAGLSGPFAGKLSDVQTNDQAAFLPSSAEATQVATLQQKFTDHQSIPAIVVYAAPAGVDHALTAKAAADKAAIAEIDGVVGPIGGPVPSKDGEALELVVPVVSGNETGDIVQHVRDLVGSGLPPGVRAYVTGPAGYLADLVESFAGIDGILLLVAVLVVLVILILVYRSPILPFAVLISALFALALASGIVYALADHGLLTLNGQSQGILFILVVGAATDYSLLLTARYREELREHESKVAAMRVAWRQALPPIVASGLTVILALLCLLLSDLNSTSSLGPVGAIGIGCSLLAALTFLPALLLLLGRAAYWPKAPAFGSPHPERSGVWGGVARLVGRRPRALWIATGAALVILAAFLPTLRAGGTTQADLFLHTVPSVTGQRVADRHFPGGTGSPAVIIGPESDTRAMVSAATRTRGVAGAVPIGANGAPAGNGRPPAVVDGLVQVQATLSAPADSDAAIDAVKRLRAAIHKASPTAKVGGTTATTLDTRTTAERDRNLVIPVVLALIFVLLMALLRAVVAPLLLLLTVVLSFAATLGVSALVFNHVLGFAAADPAVPLFGFVFLVALGVDYNIFLMSRVREESVRRGTRTGVLRGLASTGGVITSAGIVLAATFSALSVIPLLFLAQIAFIVAFGVLLDTLIVRSLLVPALVHDIGPGVWWPSRLARDRR